MNSPQNHQPWRDLAVFEGHEAGKTLEYYLADKGIATRTYDDKLFRYFLFLRPPRITYRVQVRQNQFEGATELVLSQAPELLDQALHCPDCGSLRVNYPQMTRQFVLPTVLLHLGIIFRVIEHQCYCENCQEMWDLPKEAATFRPAREVKPFPF